MDMLDKSLGQNPMFQMLEGRGGADAKAYTGLLLLVESDAREALEYIKAVFPGFTTHGMGHSLRILEKIERILSDGLRQELSVPEIFCLIMAAMFHDMGMARAAEPDRDRQREQHHLYAEGPLEEFMSQRLTLVKEWRRLYNCILFVCKAHGMERGALYGDKSFYDKDMIEGGVLRFGLLAVLLRVGDLLDLDENRTSGFVRGLNAHYFQDGTSRLHHIRHEHVDRVYLAPEVIEIEVRAENVEEYRLWEWWLGYLEGDILHANTHLMPKLGGALLLPEPKCRVQKAAGADFETEELRFELTEEGRLWTILSQYVYTEEFDFIRELVQNGIDAVLIKDYADLKVPLPAPSPRSWGEWDGGNRVVVAYSARQGSLMVWDTGIGMDSKEVRRFLFRVADSGYRYQAETREFPFPAIAKFGIGFISCLSKCEEVVLLTHPASGAGGCKVRMFSNSVRAFFEKLEGRPDSGTMVCMSLKRRYPAEEVRDYLVKTFRYPSVPVEWLDLDEMGDQEKILRGMGKLRARSAKAAQGAVMSQWEFEERYELFDAVRKNACREREMSALPPPRWRVGEAQIGPLWRHQVCMVPFGERLNDLRIITDPAEAVRYRDGKGLMAVQCGFTDWELGVEWRSIHCFLYQKGRLVCKLAGLWKEGGEGTVDVGVEGLRELGADQNFDANELLDVNKLLDAYMEKLDHSEQKDVEIYVRTLAVEQETMIQTDLERFWQVVGYDGWHELEDEEGGFRIRFKQFPVGQSGENVGSSTVIGDISRIKSGCYQDGILLDVDPTDLVPMGMCRAQVNLSAGARMELNITRHHVNEAHEVTDKWLSEVGSEIQQQVVRRLKKPLRDWGFQENTGRLCARKRDVLESYFGFQCLSQLRVLDEAGAI